MDEENVVQAKEDEDELEQDELDEPTAARTSPYAIASLVTGVLAMFELPRSLPSFFFRRGTPFEGDWLEHGVELFALFAGPVIVAILAIVLAGRAELEIDGSEGRVGGRGFAQAGVWLGRAVLILGAVAVVLLVVAATDTTGPEGRFPFRR